MASIVLVTGATGNVGRHVVRGLLELGTPVRVLARDPATARTRLPAETDVVAGDLTDPVSVAAAADGADAVFLLWPFLTAEGAAAAVDALADAAGRNSHVVHLSALSVRDDRPPADNGVWGQVEALVARSGASWTFLRPSGFATNTLAWADSLRTEGVVRWAYGGARRSLIHERDIAAVAVRALTTGRDDLAGTKPVLTGPESIAQADQVAVIGQVTGRPARWEEVPAAAVRESMLSWADAPFVDSALEYWASTVDEPEPVTTTVESITGRPARPFREWVAEHADAFRGP